ncbi:hypothetical protein [Asticcacaulis solisilvae]|uniref:hypothetical protein n=1 Tax=Asticcacaulis solisilvae TaxID=1217274 RepID=UPI003FD804D0
MKKLNGWQRIGVIASVIWIVAAGVGERIREQKYFEDLEYASVSVCEQKWQYEPMPSPDPCIEDGVNTYFNNLKAAGWSGPLIAAFLPVAVGWGLTYLILALARWVRRGFAA